MTMPTEQRRSVPTGLSGADEVAALVGGLLFGIASSRKAASTQPVSTTKRSVVTPRQSNSAQPSSTVTSILKPSSKTLASMLEPLAPPSFILEILLASEKRGYVAPFYSRTTQTIPANSIVTVTTTVSDNQFGFIVGTHTIRADPATSGATVTLVEDYGNPVFSDAALDYPVSVLGEFLRPIISILQSTVTGDPYMDIQYSENNESVLMNSLFYSDVYRPFLERQYGSIG